MSALYARKLQLAMTACIRNSVYEDFLRHWLGPFTWAVFSRSIMTLHFEGTLDHIRQYDARRRVGIWQATSSPQGAPPAAAEYPLFG